MNRFVLARGGQRVPLTIVGGPEGAGKTTLLRQLLTCSDGRRIAVALNHPSALALSAADIAKRNDDTLELRNGSVLLALDGDVGTALTKLDSAPASLLPEHVVVETSAAASLLRASGYAFLPRFRPGGMIAVVNAPEIARLREENAEPDNALEAELQHAELVVLNRVEDLNPAVRPAVRRWLQQRTARARVVESEYCRVPAAMILGAALDHVPIHAIHGEWSPAFSIETEPHRNRVLEPRHEADYRAWLLTTRATIDASAFRAWANALPDSILRGDGVLRLTGERSHRFQFHCCGLRWSLTRGEPWGEQGSEPLSWISLVGFASSSAQEGNAREQLGARRGEDRPRHFRPPLRRSNTPPSVGELS